MVSFPVAQEKMISKVEVSKSGTSWECGVGWGGHLKNSDFMKGRVEDLSRRATFIYFIFSVFLCFHLKNTVV